MPESRPQRECRDHQRMWRTHCVDRNLEDAWLEAMNALEVFDLVSICEGQVSQRPSSRRSMPHVNLRLKPGLVPVAIIAWDSLSADLSSSFAAVFDVVDSSVTIELTQQVLLRRARPTAEQKLTVRIEARRSRNSPNIDPETSDWFCRTVSSTRELDRFMQARLCPNETT
jgi:hypothetical protein